jgi:hypothetical protein
MWRALHKPNISYSSLFTDMNNGPSNLSFVEDGKMQIANHY